VLGHLIQSIRHNLAGLVVEALIQYMQEVLVLLDKVTLAVLVLVIGLAAVAVERAVWELLLQLHKQVQAVMGSHLPLEQVLV
jgi:hypothetical protein